MVLLTRYWYGEGSDSASLPVNVHYYFICKVDLRIKSYCE